MVPTRAHMRARLDDYFDAVGELAFAKAELAPCWGDDLAEDLQRVRRHHETVLEPRRRTVVTTSQTLIDSLVVGEPTPLRWTWQRWTRRALYLRWYLREGHRQRTHRQRPWRTGDDEPPF